MILSIENAKRSTCPLTMGGMSAIDGGARGARCIADQCMAWREAGEGGYCGMAGTPIAITFHEARDLGDRYLRPRDDTGKAQEEQTITHGKVLR